MYSYQIWKSKSLEACKFCNRTFQYEQLIKHQKGCNGAKHRHAYAKPSETVKKAKV